MAEILNNNKEKNGIRCIRKSTKVDLTPMVDLGFLLITFFVFTTTMSTTTAIGMVTPKEAGNDDICESCVITLIPAANDKLYYYEGKEGDAVYKTTDYSASGLRTLLVNKKRQVLGINREPILIIKPSATSTFKNLINIIDESNICLYKKYYLDKVSAVEKIKLNNQ